MMYRNRNQADTGGRGVDKDALDRELDAALAKYAAVEPRAGLEARVLANLRTEQARSPIGLGQRWSVAATLAAVIIVALSLAGTLIKSAPVVLENRPSTTTPGPRQSGIQVAANRQENAVRPDGPNAAQKRPGHRAQPSVVKAAQPKLDQFPSPQPLTEQEKILANYVMHFQEQAVLIARATNEELQRDRREIIEMPRSSAGSEEGGNQETTNR